MSPKNLALGRPCRQSSVYDGLGASVAVDGDRSGDHYRKCSCTQQDPQGWWEVDLGELVHVQQVKVKCVGALGALGWDDVARREARSVEVLVGGWGGLLCATAVAFVPLVCAVSLRCCLCTYVCDMLLCGVFQTNTCVSLDTIRALLLT